MSKKPRIYRTAQLVVDVNTPIAEQAKGTIDSYFDYIEGKPLPPRTLGDELEDVRTNLFAKIARPFVNRAFRRDIEAWRGDVTVEPTSLQARNVGQRAVEGLADTVVFDNGSRVPALAYAGMLVRLAEQWDEQVHPNLTQELATAPENPLQ